jgi:hypothetical protein
VDSIVISAHVERPDYKVIIGDIPFFQHLPHINEHAIYAPEKSGHPGTNAGYPRFDPPSPTGRRAAHLSARRHRSRSRVHAPGPDGEFNHWSRSLEIFMQRVPELQILVTIASGVISRPRCGIRSPGFAARPDRQRLAFIYQLIAPDAGSGRKIFGLTPRVTFGEIVTGNNHEHILAEIEQAARRTLPNT